MTVDPATAPFPGAASYPKVTHLGALLLAQLATRPGATALQQVDGATWSWARLGEEVAAIQSGLASRGIRPGQHVAIVCENSLRAAAAHLAVIAFGAIVIPVNTALMGAGLAHVLNHGDAALLIADPSLLPRCLGAAPAFRDAKAVATDDAAWTAAFPPTADPPRVQGEGGAAPAMILYTSGTTGDAKGAILSHTAWLTAAWASAAVMLEAQPGDVIYTSLPLFHCAAHQLALWTALLSGASVVLAPHFSASAFWSHMRRYHVKAFLFVGPVTSILWNAPPAPGDRDQPARIAVGGGPRVAWREFEDRFNLTFVECYGMTEWAGGCITHRPGQARSGRAGKALDYVEMITVDETMQPTPPGIPGEILLRPRRPNVMFSGYYKRPDLTAAALHDGWYRTLDIGTIDAEGYLTFAARKRDIIRRRGENVSAAEVDAVLATHPDISECAVVGVPAELGEEDILAVVVPKQESLDLASVVAHASAHLPFFAVPRFFATAPSLPKTATSRVQRHLLRPLLHGAIDRIAP
ncbi:MAG: AMP-binding protein [Acetobacteraceae bacterium]|nr:AMP-binding protein [Acetobacteraceae bacterium]